MATRKRQNARKRKNVNRILLLGLFLVAVAVVVAVAWRVIADGANTGMGGEQTGEPTLSQDSNNNGDDDADMPDETSGDASLPVTEPDKGVQHDTPSTGDTLNVWTTISSVSGGTLLIRVQIDQNISGGTCELTISSYKKSVPVVAQPQSASCDGFDVPTSAYSGDEFSVVVKSGDKSGSTKGKING